MSKPYKVYDNQRKGYGVVASSFEEFVRKSKEKFGIISDNVKILLLDGNVEVDKAYFEALERSMSFVITENIVTEEEAAYFNFLLEMCSTPPPKFVQFHKIYSHELQVLSSFQGKTRFIQFGDLIWDYISP